MFVLKYSAMEAVTSILHKADSFLWGAPLIILLIGTGIFLTVKLGFLQVSKLPLSLKLIFKAKSQIKI